MDFTAITNLLSPEVLSILSTIGAIAYAIAVAATQLPKATEDSSIAYKVVRAIIDFIAANYGSAKNG